MDRAASSWSADTEANLREWAGDVLDSRRQVLETAIKTNSKEKEGFWAAITYELITR